MTYHKSVFTLTVLTEDKPLTSKTTLDQIVCGEKLDSYVTELTFVGAVELTGKQAADALVAQGLDPSHFHLNEDGEPRYTEIKDGKWG